MSKWRINLGGLSCFCYLRESRAWTFWHCHQYNTNILYAKEPFDKGSDSVLMSDVFRGIPIKSLVHEAHRLSHDATEPVRK